MKKYQVKNFFEWGSLKLEPLQHLSVEESNYPNSYNITLDKNNESIVVSRKSFENQLQMGNISKA